MSNMSLTKETEPQEKLWCSPWLLAYAGTLTTVATQKRLRGEACPFISDVFIDGRVFEHSCHA